MLPGGGPATGTGTATPASGTQAPRESGPSAGDPLKPVKDFLDVLGNKHENGEPTTCRQPDASKYSVRFLIATVPDPLDSHLAYMFDRAVDAIQKGAQESGYALDRLFFPWKKDL